VALVSNALTTVARVCRALAIDVPTGEALTDVEQLIAQASGAIEGYCDRRFGKATVTAEKVRGYGSPVLRLLRYPLISVSAVTLNSVAVDSSTWGATPTEEDAAQGVLRHLTGDWEWTADFQRGASPEQRAGTERPLYAVTYVGGYVLPKDDSGGTPRTLPYELERACLDTCVYLYRTQGRDPSIVSESLLSASVTYAQAGSEAGGLIPAHVLPQLEPFRRWA
jgi:hypothetical protein